MSGAVRANGVAGWCVRCGGELPARDNEGLLFCPHCGAAQLMLPEHLRVVTEDMPGASTTGMVPPPRPQVVDWRAVLQSAGLIGGVAAVLMALGMLVDVLQAVGTLWVVLSGLTAAWLYGRLRPTLPMNARVGVRVGVVAGLASVSLAGIVLMVGGLVDRFALHRGAELDDWVTKGIAVGVAALNQPGMNQPLNAQLLGILQSPEGRAGYMLMNFALDALFLVGVAAVAGAVAGTMASRRSRVGHTP